MQNALNSIILTSILQKWKQTPSVLFEADIGSELEVQSSNIVIINLKETKFLCSQDQHLSVRGTSLVNVEP